MFIADFHVHTNRSDGKLSLREVVDLYGKRRFGAIAITDHLCERGTVLGNASRFLKMSLNEDNFAEHMGAIHEENIRAQKKYGMLVMPGYEVTKNFLSNHRSAHVLALGTDKYVDPNLEIRELCRAIRAVGGLAIAAHPVSTRRIEKQTYHLWDRRHELSGDFDAWEVASGPHLFPEVLHSGLPMIANSDLHVAKQITSWKTVLECAREPAAILQAIRDQEIKFSFYRDAAAPARAQNFSYSPYPAI